MDAHHTYYRAMHGRWHGELRVAIIDPDAFRAAPIGAFDRLQARVAAWLGELSLDTALGYPSEGEAGTAIHRARVSRGGIPLFTSLERFALQPDGRTVAIDGKVWYPPIPWPLGDFGPDARAVVEGDARGATYHFRSFGSPVVQTTRIRGEDELEIRQDFGWGRGEVVLRRISREL